MRVCFISVPYDMGKHNLGHGKAPGILMSSGLKNMLSWAASSYDVVAIAITAFAPAHDMNGTIREALMGIILTAANAIAIR